MTPALTHTTSSFLAYLAEPALRSLLVGGVAGLALAALRAKRVAVRLYVWTAVLCVALAMPLLGVLVPRMPLAIPARDIQKLSQRVPLPIWQPILQRARLSAGTEAERVAKGANVAKARPEQSGRVFRPEGVERFSQAAFATTLDPQRAKGLTSKGMSYIEGARTSVASWKQEQQGSAAYSFAPAEMPIMPLKTIAVVAGEPAISLAQFAAEIALGIYLFVALLLFVRLLAGMWFSGKLERAAREISPLYFKATDDPENRSVREVMRLVHFRASIAGTETPRVKESAAISVPATVGIARPAILLPAEWRAWPEEQLDAVLAHEVSHVARRDALTQTLSLVHRAIFWFSPLAWWLDKQLTELAEQASDEAALAGGADRTRYAETLLGFFAQLDAVPGRIWWQGVSMAKKSRGSSAERRVDRILAWKGTRSFTKSLAIALVAIAAPIVFMAASLHPVIAYGQDKTQSDGQNVIMPGGPKAPALPSAPQGGVPAAPALANAPRGGVHGGVVKPAALAPAPGTPALPATPAPGQGVEAPGPMPPAPQGGVVAPMMPPAPTGPRTTHPSAQTPQASTASVASAAPTSSMASTAPMAAIAGASTPAPGQDQDEEAQAADLRRQIEEARKQVAADAEQVRDAQQRLAKAQSSAQGSDTDQIRSAEANLREAQEKVERAHDRLARVQERIDRIASARAESRAQEQSERAQEMAQRDAERKQRVNEQAMEQAERAQRDAERAQEEAERTQDSTRTININGGSYTMGGGARYVMFTGGNNVSMSGDDEDLHHAENLRKKLGKDLIWFERDEKSYVITDPEFIAKARALFAPEDALAKQQDDLGRQQDELGRQQDALGEQMDKVSVKPPDVTDDLQQIQARLKQLQATGATQSELGEIQSELGRLQSEVGRVQSQAGVQQSGIGRQQADLGRKQAALGRQQAELGRQEAAISKEANRQLRGMFDDAISKGIAKPE